MRTFAVSASFAALTTALLVPSATATPEHAPSLTMPTATASVLPQTRLTFAVDTCENCEIGLVQALQHPSGQWTVWRSDYRPVVHGRVSFRVATRRTYGMSIEVSAPWQTGGNARPNAVVRYRNTNLGQTITNQVARNKRWASGCWAGTTSRDVTIPLRVAKYPLRRNDGSPGVSARVWFQQMRRIVPTPYSNRAGNRWVYAPHGAIATQDAFACRSNRS